MNDRSELAGACHCGAVRFHVQLPDSFESARRCDCSYCRMRGAVAVSAKLGDIVFEKGEDLLTLYRFNTQMAEHYFCSRCGIYTYHKRRSNPNEIGINVACLEGKSPFDFACVPVYDGVTHPADTGGRGYRIAGYLRYRKAEQSD